MKRATVVTGLPVTERELFIRVQTGDREAFRVLFRHHQHPVYLAAFRVLRSRADAEEIMQDTFLTMWKKRAKINLLGESALPWLLTTARFLAMNRQRATTRNTRESLDEAGKLADLALSPEAETGARERTEQIEAFISAMPQVDKEILRLSDELSYEQAAHRLALGASALLLVGGAATPWATLATPRPEQYSASCYSQATTTSHHIEVGTSSPSDDPDNRLQEGKVSDPAAVALEQCALAWRTGTLLVAQNGTSADSGTWDEVPALQLCEQNAQDFAVFPRTSADHRTPQQFCTSLGMDPPR